MIHYKNVQHRWFPRLKVEILSIGQNVDKLWPVDVLGVYGKGEKIKILNFFII